ncbi:hypothetical protein L3Q82_019286 [Scortum barcoo]|uniref:Uncharacterized protein n=1 Tax=Scortum barcoo TaxID=214431 RepID=A0ACB8VCX8_9TELE|nr:hypothetical protein L3Q82_019286 [Scortum barcoo]
MWRGIKCITDYNTRDAQCPRDPSLPDALNNFYARFDDPNTSPSTRFTPPPGEEPLRVTAAEVRRTLQRINPRKAAGGPDNISGRVLKGCAYQLTEVLTDIFNTTSLQQAAVPTCLKTATIIPIPKASTVTGLNDYRPVALTPIVMKCFERLVMAHIKDCCVDRHCGPAPRYIRACLIVKFADDTAVVGQIANNDESDYRQEVEHLEGWCRQNNLCINVKKTKEMIVDFRRGRHLPSPLYIRRDCGGSGLQLQEGTSLYFLRRLRRAGLGSSVLTSFYRCVVESVLSSCIIVWHGSCSAAEKKALQRVVKAAQRTARRLRSIKSRTTRLRNSFFPEAVRLLNSPPPLPPPSFPFPPPPSLLCCSPPSHSVQPLSTAPPVTPVHCSSCAPSPSLTTFSSHPPDTSISHSVLCPSPPSAPPCSSLLLTTHQVRNALKKNRARKAAGPDGISSRLLKSCADQLCGIFGYTFNLSLKLGRVPQLWKTSCIVPVPKTPHPKGAQQLQDR